MRSPSAWIAMMLGQLALASQPASAQQMQRVWISSVSALLGQASDIAVGPDGSVYVLDRLNAYLLILREPGNVRLKVGRNGSGPGEFKDPTGIHVVGRSFEILDRANNRLQRFDSLGQYVSARQLPPLGATYPVGVSHDGHIAVNSLSDSSLVTLYDPTNRRVARFARPSAPMPAAISMSAVRQEVLDGKVPGFFRNTAKPFFAADNTIRLAMLTDGIIQRWSPAGKLLVAYQLDEPEMRETRKVFFDQYRDPNFKGLHSLSYIADLYPTTSGVWVLLNRTDEGPVVILRISPGGQRTGRWVFPGVTGAALLAVDEANRRVFLTISSTAEVVEVSLPNLEGSRTRLPSSW